MVYKMYSFILFCFVFLKLNGASKLEIAPYWTMRRCVLNRGLYHLVPVPSYIHLFFFCFGLHLLLF